MGFTQEDQRRACELFNLAGHIYKVRVGKYTYVRLQFYTADVDEQGLLVRVFGGQFINHMGRRHMWEISKKSRVYEVLVRLKPYLKGERLVKANAAIDILAPPTEIALHVRLREAHTLAEKLAILKERPP